MVGFKTNEDGKTALVKLTCNDKEVFLKGVITRNQYLEARAPSNNSQIGNFYFICLFPLT